MIRGEPGPVGEGRQTNPLRPKYSNAPGLIWLSEGNSLITRNADEKQAADYDFGVRRLAAALQACGFRLLDSR
jgi:hypothetical protein